MSMALSKGFARRLTEGWVLLGIVDFVGPLTGGVHRGHPASRLRVGVDQRISLPGRTFLVTLGVAARL